VLPPEAPLGVPLAEYLGDVFFNFEITPNRPDCLSVIGLARETVGIKDGLGGIFMDLKHILLQLEAERRFITEIEAEMGATLERIPFSSRLLSIKGLGIVSVAGLIGEVGDFSKFSTTRRS
jgi:hypothetical protein